VQLDVQDPQFEVFLQRLLELGQQGLDSADPLDYARRWQRDPFPGFAPRRVLMQEGIGDQLVSNDSTEALAAAGGLVAQRAMSNPAGVSGLWRFDPPGGHGIFSRSDVREQAFRFLGSGGTVILAEGCRSSDECLAGVDHCVPPGVVSGVAAPCTGDADCGTGVCVVGGCYDSLGSCVANPQ